MKPLVTFALVLLAGVHQDSSVQVVGTFSNVYYTEEHVYGAKAELWQHRDSLFGMMYFYEGYASDAPRGLVQDVAYKPTTGELSFSVKLSMGLHFCKAHNNVPSRDVAFFDGILYGDSMAGTLTMFDSLDAVTISSDKITLQKSEELTKEQAEWKYQDVTDWRKRYWEEAHKWLGPKW